MDSYYDYIDFDKWRNWLYKICIKMVAVIFGAELIFLVFIRQTGLLRSTLLIYALHYLLLPTLINIFAITIAAYAKNHETLSETAKNYILSLVFFTICVTVECTHYVFSPVLCAPCVAIFMTVLFAKPKLTRLIFQLSMVSLLAAWWLSYSNPYYVSEYLLFNVIISFIITLCSYSAAKVLTRFERQRVRSVYESYKEQYEMTRQIKLEPMTGLYNREVFIQKLEEYMKRSETEGKSLYLAMVDLDNFKMINDTYGHVYGDEVLLRLSEMLKHFVTQNGVAGRYGGEEFIFLLYDMTPGRALRVAESIRVELERQRFDFTQRGKITLSCGLCEYFDGDWTVKEFIDKADSNLYRAKKRGKNNTVFSRNSKESEGE